MSTYTVLSEQALTAEESRREAFALDVLLGLSAEKKYIPSKYFYDRRGSELFARITDLEEYYPTACEADVLERHGDDIAARAPVERFNLVELGAGDGRKTKLLIESLLGSGKRFRYVPIDISEAAIANLTESMGRRFPDIECRGLVSEYYDALRWMNGTEGEPNLVLFLGSNIGNFDAPHIRVFLRTLWNAMNAGDLLLVGFDMKKDIEVLLRAYNDSAGVTEQFNLNVLERINRELGGDFDLSRFEHFGTYDVFSGAMESYLLSLQRQRVFIGHLDRGFDFLPYEPIHLEYSYKFLPEDIERLARETGFERVASYYDSKRWFADALWKVRKSPPPGR